MGIPRFFKLPDNKKFSYSPIYWNPEKEEREQRIRSIKQEMGIEVKTDSRSSAITRGSFRHKKIKSTARANRDSNRRLLLIVIVLLLLAYILFYR